MVEYILWPSNCLKMVLQKALVEMKGSHAKILIQVFLWFELNWNGHVLSETQPTTGGLHVRISVFQAPENKIKHMIVALDRYGAYEHIFFVYSLSKYESLRIKTVQLQMTFYSIRFIWGNFPWNSIDIFIFWTTIALLCDFYGKV